MKTEKKIKAALILTFLVVLSVSIYERNITPILCMSIGVIAGPLGTIIAGVLGIILTFYFLR